MAPVPRLSDLRDCFEGAVPAVIATASADGTPNVTYLSRVVLVDEERVALSNQFFSKTARNLAENPRASVLVLDVRTYEQYRLTLVYERTDRRGPVFERLRRDVDITAALQGLQDVFHLRAADVYRVLEIEHVVADVHRRGVPAPEVGQGRHDGLDASRIAELSGRLGRCGDLDALVECALDGLAGLFGYEHSILLLHDEADRRLFTIASHGYAVEGVGSEAIVGEGVLGLVAERAVAVRTGNARQLAKYARTVRQSFDEESGAMDARDIPVPGLTGAKSQVAVPAMAFGTLVGVLLVEDPEPVAFSETDESVLTVIASAIAAAIEIDRTKEVQAAPAPAPAPLDDPAPGPIATRVRCYGVDGSVFVDGAYLIKGVAGRILASLLRQHRDEGRVDFTSREVRLDPSLELPSFRDNFDSRLILLKRRLDERVPTIRIDKTGRGRFSLVVDGAIVLEEVVT